MMDDMIRLWEIYFRQQQHLYHQSNENVEPVSEKKKKKCGGETIKD